MNLKYYKAFFLDGAHLALGVATLGAGFVAASIPALIGGAAAYALGLIFLPESPWFRKVVDRREAAALAARRKQAQAERRRQVEVILKQCRPADRLQYKEVEEICGEILAHLNKSELDSLAEPTEDRLDTLRWGFLELLVKEGRLMRFLEKENEKEILAGIAATEKEMNGLAQSTASPAANARLRESLSHTLKLQRQRLQQLQEGKANLALLVAEENRITEQLKTLRGDLLALGDPAAMTDRVNATLFELAGTQRILRELSPEDPLADFSASSTLQQKSLSE